MTRRWGEPGLVVVSSCHALRAGQYHDAFLREWNATLIEIIHSNYAFEFIARSEASYLCNKLLFKYLKIHHPVYPSTENPPVAAARQAHPVLQDKNTKACALTFSGWRG